MTERTEQEQLLHEERLTEEELREALKGKKEVFKYQTNLNAGPDMPPRSRVLVYNKDRSIQGEFPMTPQIEKEIFKGKWKVYMKAVYFPKTKQVVAIKPTHDRGW